MTSVEKFENLADLISFHLKLHRGCRPGDIYKMLHQSVFGPEHLGDYLSESAVSEEMTGRGSATESLLEAISVDGQACRINLRVASKEGVTPRLVVEAVRRSAGRFDRNPETLSRLWHEAQEFLKRSSWEHCREEELMEISRMVIGGEFPPLHHSDSYRKLNRPAYRVLMRPEFCSLMQLPDFVR